MPTLTWLTKARTRLARVCVAAALSLASGHLRADGVQDAGDGDARLIGAVRVALLSADPAALRQVSTPTVSLGTLQVFLRMAELGPTEVTIRERGRTTTDGRTRLIVDLLASAVPTRPDPLGMRAPTGRLATWEISTESDGSRRVVTSILELSAIDGLVRASLDPTRQFAVHDFIYEAPDFTLTARSGDAFVAEADTGHAGLVIRGRGRVRFAPKNQTEQGQLRLFGGAAAYTSAVTDAFIRLPPGALATYVATGELQPGHVDPKAWRRAAAVYTQESQETFGIELGDLSGDRWSVNPPAGAAVVEFRSTRHGWLTYTRTPEDVDDISLFDRARKRQVSLYSSRGTAPSFVVQTGAAYDVQHYDLDLQIDPARSWIAGRASLRLTFRTPPAGLLTLRLAEPLAISSVSSPALGRLLAIKATGRDEFVVTLPTRDAVPREMRLDIEYAGRLEPQATVAERPASADTTSDAETLSARGGRLTPRYLYSTQRAWYPQAPTRDYATATIRVSTPGDLRAIATGEPRAIGPGVSTFVADRPVPYLSCVISAWVEVGRARAAVPAVAPTGDATSSPARDDATVAITTVASANQAPTSGDLAPAVGRMVSFFAREVGEAPFPAFTLAAIDDDLPAGHSPAYFALLQQPSDQSIAAFWRDPVAFEDVPEFFLAHEVAHQWWGQAVGYRLYQDQWLSEGLAQYFALRYVAATRGVDVTSRVLARMRDSAVNLEAEGPITLGFRLGHIRGTGRVVRAILYNKTALVLDMLRRLIGDDAFSDGLRRYYRAWHSRNAGTDDLRRALEQASGRSLARFFDQWIRGAALPTLRFQWRVVQGGVAGRIDQVGEPFEIPVTVVVEGANGLTETFVVPISGTTTEWHSPWSGRIRRVKPVTADTLARW